MSTTLPIKAQAGAIGLMLDVLGRAVNTGQITGFRVTVMSPKRINQVRSRLRRWPDALGTIKEVDWNL